MPRRIALISCTKSKTSYPAPARVLYSESDLFRKALAYVEPNVDEVFVLSAKYGLVALDQPLEPYEQTLKTMSTSERRAWAERVLGQIRQRFGSSLTGLVFEFHTGVEYRQHLAPLLAHAGATCTCPVEGLAIGERLSFYGGGRTAAEAAKEPTPSSEPSPATARDRVLPTPGEPGFAEIWARIEAHAGEPFHQVRGGEFRYQVSGRSLRLDRTNQLLPYSQLEQGYQLVPLASTAQVQHLRAPSYIYAILMDPRIRREDW